MSFYPHYDSKSTTISRILYSKSVFPLRSKSCKYHYVWCWRTCVKKIKFFCDQIVVLCSALIRFCSSKQWFLANITRSLTLWRISSQTWTPNGKYLPKSSVLLCIWWSIFHLCKLLAWLHGSHMWIWKNCKKCRWRWEMELLQDTAPSYRETRGKNIVQGRVVIFLRKKKHLSLCLDYKNLPSSYLFAP